MTSPYRPLPVLVREPRQTWWGRYARVRRWLGGKWELRARGPSVVPLLELSVRWVRVAEYSVEDRWRDGRLFVTVVGRQREDGSVVWAEPDVCWSHRDPAWESPRVRRSIGGCWERWHTQHWFDTWFQSLQTTGWIPVNRWTQRDAAVKSRALSFWLYEREWYVDGQRFRSVWMRAPVSPAMLAGADQQCERGPR